MLIKPPISPKKIDIAPLNFCAHCACIYFWPISLFTLMPTIEMVFTYQYTQLVKERKVTPPNHGKCWWRLAQWWFWFIFCVLVWRFVRFLHWYVQTPKRLPRPKNIRDISLNLQNWVQFHDLISLSFDMWKCACCCFVVYLYIVDLPI